MSTAGYQDTTRTGGVSNTGINSGVPNTGVPTTAANENYTDTAGPNGTYNDAGVIGTENRNQNRTVDPTVRTEYTKRSGLGFLLMDVPLVLLRLAQFACSVIVLGLLAYVLHGYDFHGSHKTNYSLATAVISTFYLLMLPVFTAALARFFVPGAYLLMEITLTILWLCAFIVLADAHGSHSCGLSQTSTYNASYGSYSSFLASSGYYDPFLEQYTTRNYGRPCRSAKAAIAFSGLAFILFLISTVLVGVFVVRPMLVAGGSKAFMQPYTSYGFRLNRMTGLNVMEEGGAAAHNEPEAVGQDQRTFSTGDSTYNGTHPEKVGDGHQRNMSGVTDMADPVVAAPVTGVGQNDVGPVTGTRV